MPDHHSTYFPVTETWCTTPGCPQFREPDHRLQCWSTPEGNTGLRCEECETVWENAAAYFNVLSPRPQVWSGLLVATIAVVGVWFLYWPLWLKSIMAALAFVSLLQAIPRTLYRLGRRRAFVLLSELTLPANLEADEAVLKRLHQLSNLSRMNALKAQKGSVMAWLQKFKTQRLPAIIETQHWVRLCRPDFFEPLPERLKKARFTETEHLHLQENLKHLQWVAQHRAELKKAWEDDLSRLSSIIFVLQDLVLTESGLEQPLRIELARLLNRSSTLDKLLRGETMEVDEEGEVVEESMISVEGTEPDEEEEETEEEEMEDVEEIAALLREED